MKPPAGPWVAPGFEKVGETFDRLVAQGAGMAFAATVDGTPAVDLWGGNTGGGAPWHADTPVLMFSGTKGVVAAAMLMLIERGLIALDQPLVELWPEFGEEGKEQVSISHVLSHTAGLPGLLTPPPDPLDQLAVAFALAGQRFLTPLGSPSYHAFTFGSLCDQVMRRVDGRSTGQFVAEEIRGPLGLDLWIGTPPPVAANTVVPFRRSDFRLAAELAAAPDPRLDFVYGPYRDLDWRASLHREIPAANGAATARSMARFYGCLARGGEIDRVRLLSPSVTYLAHRQLAQGPDVLSGRLLRFSAGFELAGTPSVLGPLPDAFGFTGSGGSSHGAWPSLRVGFSLMVIEMRPETDDDRASRLLEALAGCLR
ncbi:MAG TPA: serine hydrolase domain-containing protein [Acidimicrobiia bacterium]|nr:serine hydrolase domain-containing protein [Acidimicrobiia bacterium]